MFTQIEFSAERFKQVWNQELGVFEAIEVTFNADGFWSEVDKFKSMTGLS